MTIEDAIQLLTEAKVALATVEHHDHGLADDWHALMRTCSDVQARIGKAIVAHQQSRDERRRDVEKESRDLRRHTNFHAAFNETLDDCLTGGMSLPDAQAAAERAGVEASRKVGTEQERCSCPAKTYGSNGTLTIGTAVEWRGNKSFCRECGLFVATRVTVDEIEAGKATVEKHRAPPLFPNPARDDRPYPYARGSGWQGPCSVCGKLEVLWRAWGAEPDPNRFCDGPSDWYQTDVHMDPDGSACKGTGMPVEEFDRVDWVKASRDEMDAKSRVYRVKEKAARAAKRKKKA